MKLFYTVFGEGEPLIILHGLFGSSDNWISIGKKLSSKYKVYLIDLRNHGKSPHSNEFDYDSMSKDLDDFIHTHQIVSPYLLGHSMGGKVVMQYAIDYPASWKKLVVVDIGAKYYSVHHDEILKGLNSIELQNLASRQEAYDILLPYVRDAITTQFLLKNLTRGEKGFEWKINLPIITSKIENVGTQTRGKLLIEKPVLFLRGSDSNYIKDSDEAFIKSKFPTSTISTIQNAGHWVHAEKPSEFVDKVLQFF